MPEIKYDYTCPRCVKTQGHLFRFPVEEQVSHSKMVEKLRKAYFTCRYCGFRIKATKLESKYKIGWDNVLNTKTTAQINMESDYSL